MLTRISIFIIWTAVGVQSAHSQIVISAVTDWRDSSAKQIVARFRGNPLDVVPILRQSGKPQPRAKLDEIADSLVRLAVASDISRPNRAYTALRDAGRKALESVEGPPLPGILDRLIQIDREMAPGRTDRANGMRYILQMPEHSRAVSYVLGVVTSDPGVIGWQAMVAVLEEIDPENKTRRATTQEEIAESTRALRALWNRYSAEPIPADQRSGLVPVWLASRVIPNDDARLALSDYAREHGWGGGRKP